MRKVLLIVALVLIALPSAAKDKERKASPYKYEVNVAWGFTPMVAIDSMQDYIYYYDNKSLDHIYGNYIGRQVTTGLMSADFNIQFKRRIALGIQFNAVAIVNTEMSPITNLTDGKYTDYALSLLPYARFTYMNRELVKMYSSVGLGLGFNHDVSPGNQSSETNNSVMPRFQVVPFGIMAGKRIYGLAELGLGTEYMGFRIGAGYRF